MICFMGPRADSTSYIEPEGQPGHAISALKFYSDLVFPNNRFVCAVSNALRPAAYNLHGAGPIMQKSGARLPRNSHCAL